MSESNSKRTSAITSRVSPCWEQYPMPFPKNLTLREHCFQNRLGNPSKLPTYEESQQGLIPFPRSRNMATCMVSRLLHTTGTSLYWSPFRRGKPSPTDTRSSSDVRTTFPFLTKSRPSPESLCGIVSDGGPLRVFWGRHLDRINIYKLLIIDDGNSKIETVPVKVLQ